MTTETATDLVAEPMQVPEPATPAESPESAETDTDAADQPETYPAQHVKELRDELAKGRIKSRRVDEANARLAAAYAATDGRLVDATALAYSEDLLDEGGLVSPEKVAGAITALIAEKTYLASRRPTAPIAQGTLPDAPRTEGLFDLIRARA